MSFQISPEALQRYIMRRQKDLETLKSSLATQNFEQIQNIAHQIKGNAPTFGFNELGERAKVLENNSFAKNLSGLEQDIQWIESWLKEKIPS